MGWLERSDVAALEMRIGELSQQERRKTAQAFYERARRDISCTPTAVIDYAARVLDVNGFQYKARQLLTHDAYKENIEIEEGIAAVARSGVVTTTKQQNACVHAVLRGFLTPEQLPPKFVAAMNAQAPLELEIRRAGGVPNDAAADWGVYLGLHDEDAPDEAEYDGELVRARRELDSLYRGIVNPSGDLLAIGLHAGAYSEQELENGLAAHEAFERQYAVQAKMLLIGMFTELF